jgi:alpha-N-acetylglucosamine transferase
MGAFTGYPPRASPKRLDLRLGFVLTVGFLWLIYASTTSPGYFSGLMSFDLSRLNSPRYAYATILSSSRSNYTLDDPIVTATRVLAFQILHHPKTKTTRNIPFLVLTSPEVPVNIQYILTAEGATIIPIDYPKTKLWQPHPHQSQAIEQITMLRLFELTQFDRILYLNSETLLTRSLDPLWSEAEAIPPMLTKEDTIQSKAIKTPTPKEYFIAGVHKGNSQAFQDQDFSSTGQIPIFGSGFLLLKPCTILHKYYEAMMNSPDSFNTPPEMGILNYAHRHAGMMPWFPLTIGKWSSDEPSLFDVQHSTTTLHARFWESRIANLIDPELIKMWWRVQGQMEGYWQAKSPIMLL